MVKAVKEMKTYIENILKEQDGFKLGDPWKYSKKSMGAIVPILRYKAGKRDYITLPEVKDKVKFEDTGSIDGIKVTGVDLPLFIRAGTILEGVGTQSRAPTHSVILEPKVDAVIDVRCIHASHGISGGSGFKYEGYTPRMVTKSLHKGNQGRVWGSVRGHGETSYLAMSHMSLSPSVSQSERALLGSLQSDSLPKIKKAQQKLDKKLQDILKEVPVMEHQIGAIIVGASGIVGIESFDHPESWKAQYKEVIESYSDELGEEAKLFTFDESEIMNAIKDFLKKIGESSTTIIDKGKTFAINLEGFIGEFVKNNGHLIHMFLMKSDEDEEPEKSKNIYRERTIGSTFIGGATQQRPMSFDRLQLDKLTYKTTKKKYGDITTSINKYKNGATWQEIYDDRKPGTKGKKMSSATLSSRLKEGKELGIIGEKLRKSDGKKVYTLHKEE